MAKIKVNFEKSVNYITSADIDRMIPKAVKAHEMISNKTGPGNKFLGWLDLPVSYDRVEIERLKRCAWKIRSDSDILIVVGIGGSYLGTRAASSFLGHSFEELLQREKTGAPLILYAGNSISSTYHAELLEIVRSREISINVISKSGTTTEPALAFRLLKDLMEKKYGEKEAAERIYATTDSKKGALRELSEAKGYQTFIIPDDIGGRYSVLTPVGLLPIAVGGADIDKMLNGAQEGYEEYLNTNILKNACYMYAVARNILYNKGKHTEIMVNYEPGLHYLTEWWKQLFGESEGKEGKGIFPAGVDFTTDLHSMGQYIQEGMRNIFETVLMVEEAKKDIVIKADKDDLDGLNYLEGMSLDHINKKAFEATMLAHLDGGVPQISISIPKRDEYVFGKLVYFFEKACALSGYILGVNPFDQPGVEAYKKNMFALLGKPGYEDERENLLKRL